MRLAVVTIPRRARNQQIAVTEGQFVRLSRAAGAAGAGIGAGALTEFLFDPRMGGTRRARIRDKAARYSRKTERAVEVTSRDLANRRRGVVAEARQRMRGHAPVDERVLAERVRAELGRHIGHPGWVDVEVADGVVRLHGDVLAREQRPARRAVKHVRGVRKVEADWNVHRRPAGVPGLQGQPRSKRPRPEALQQHWSPTARLLAGAGAVSTWSAARSFSGLLPLGIRAGSVLLGARAVTNMPVRRLTGIGAGRRAIDVEDAISISASPERVWELIGDYTNFPKFMSNVREVRLAPDGRRSHWEVAGPAGAPVRFEAEETRRIEGRELAWKTVEGQRIAHTGAIRLDREPTGHTRVQVQMTYNPVAGAVGHAVAALLGSDPVHRLNEDLMRLKSTLETGKPPADATRAEAVRT